MRRTRYAGKERRRETPRMLKNKEMEKGGRQRRLGWPKVARVEYWNALPEAISVRCPPFVLLSCPLSKHLPPFQPPLSLLYFFALLLLGRCDLSVSF